MQQEFTESWERKTIETLLLQTVHEQRRRRRWGIFFKLLGLVIFLGVLFLFKSYSIQAGNGSRALPHISVIDIDGVIDSNSAANADHVIEGLSNAIEDQNTKAIVLRINSPGGSPVQAAQIYDEIFYLRAHHPDIKIYTICDDLCTSAAYYIASASTAIYANRASLVGSIGVLIDGFGFSELMKKIGIERRLLTSGAHKGFLDPFTPLKPDDLKIAQKLLDDAHQQFIEAVKQGRGKRLNLNDADLFSGLAWTGQQALSLGLIDGFHDLNSLARDVVKNKNIVNDTVKPGFLDQISDSISGKIFQGFKSQLNVGSKLLQ